MATTEELRDYLKWVTADLHQTRQRLQDVESAGREPIAVVGIGVRLPGGVHSPEDLWRLVSAGEDAVGDFPDDRGWDVDGVYDPNPGTPGKSYTRCGGFVRDAVAFDAAFFGISPREALAMDPQQRLLLETTWEALEHAGVDPAALEGSKIGVYTGLTVNDYTGLAAGRSELDGFILTGGSASVAAGRVSYVLGVEGPAVTVDTACSSSLVTIHLAAQALRSGECTMALAGGATVMATPGGFVEFARQRGLAADGRCKSFAEAADGTGWAEGAGVLVLERLSDAERNGRRILGVIRGSAVNQDGASNGLTAPNGPSQQRVIRQALANAGLSASEVDVVEAHGTGTVLGDPIEAQALLATYGKGRETPLYLGSLKSNIGHAQAASGVAGVIKMLLAMRHGVMPKTLHVDTPSTKVDWSAGSVELLTEPRGWPASDRPRRAGVSAFGVSGTNAHVIVEEAPAAPAADESTVDGLVPIVLSARSAEALRAQAARLVEADVELGALASGLLGRSLWEHRAVVLAADREEAVAGLTAVAEGRSQAGVVTGTTDGDECPVVFAFTGQGAQRAGMGRELYEAYPVFAARFDEVCAALSEWVEHSVRDAVFSGDLLDQTVFTQSGLFAFEVALAALLESWGVRPDVVVGHSIGELSAAFVAGVWSLSDAAKLVAARGRLMQALPSGGAMTAIAATEAEVVEALVAGVGIAAVNGPDAVVISGEADAVAAVTEVFAGRGRKVKSLAVSHAFHSHLMEPMLAEFAEVARSVEYSEPKIGIVSTMTGERSGWTTPEYWVEQIRRPVRYADAVAAVPEAQVWVEIGPDAVLTPLTLDSARAVALCRRDQPESRTVLAGLGAVFTTGVHVDWSELVPARGWVELPAYPFQRERYWLTAGTAAGDLDGVGLAASGHPLLGAVVEAPESGGVVLTGRISLGTHPWLADHAVSGVVVVPGAALVEMAIHAGDLVDHPVVDELIIEAPLRLTGAELVRIQARVGDAEVTGRRPVSVHAHQNGVWTRHATGFLSGECGDGAELTDWPPRGARAVDVADLYPELEELGYDYGPAFRCLTSAWARGDELFGEIALPDSVEADGFGIHPAMLDASTHLMSVPAAEAGDDETVALAFSWERVALHATGARAARVRITTGPAGRTIDLADERGAPVLGIGLYVTRPVQLAELRKQRPTGREGLFALDWVRVPHVVGALDDSRWTVSHVETGGPGNEAERVRDALGQVLGTLQAFVADPALNSSRLVVTTRGAVACTEDDRVDPAAAAVWGLVRAAQVENPDRILLADLDDSLDVDPDALTSAGEWQIAVRANEVLVPRLVRAGNDDERDALDPAGTVLITGGTGGLGALTARHLVTRHGMRSLVLASRRGLDAPGARELRAELEELGARVEVVSCDVAQRDEVRALLARVPADAPLTAVVHTAGVLDDGVLTALTPDRLATVLAAKADAALHLDELTRGSGLSAFVLFSSTAGVLGGGGQGNYGAANTVLDAIAERRRAAGEAAVSIAWGYWAQAGGMTAGLGEADRARLAAWGMRGLTEQSGLDLLDASLAAAPPVVVAADLDLAVLRQRLDCPAVFKVLAGRGRRTAQGGGDSGLVTKLAGLAADEQIALLTDLVRAEAAAVLGGADASLVRAGQAFKDAGFDSLTAVELRNRLTALSGVRLPATLVFDYPNATVLAEHLRREVVGATATADAPRAAVSSQEPIAVVGLGIRLPGGVSSPEELWDLVAGGGDAVGEFPADRGWDLAGLYDPDPDAPGKSYVRHGGFLNDAAEFDAGFFGISPREALAMDPQQRLLLETSWEALERAGIDPASLRGRDVGVYTGLMYHDYGTTADPVPAGLEGLRATGISGSVAAGRVSYVLGVEGPAVMVDTACSSSLVAIHLASQALRSGECSMALAGGATIMAHPGSFIELSRQRGLAVDGRCKAFSDSADGTGWAEGVGVLVLERLSDAQRNGRRILGVVRGSAVNQDGASNGLTAPNGPSQQRVIRQALANAGLTTAEVDVVEAHGTGTTLGDPIEAQAVLATYGQDRETPLYLGSLKSNIGHAQAAAGVAGVIKMLLAMRHGVMPKTLHVDTPSTKIDWTEGAVELLVEQREWPQGSRPRRAGVSSFGVSGTNAHVIVEEAPGVSATVESTVDISLPVVLSARSPEALRAYADRLARTDVELGGLASGLLTRTSWEHRAVVLAADRDELAAGLRAVADARHEVVAGEDLGPVVFAFTGQGAQRAGMGRELYEAYPVFAARFDEVCAELDAALSGWVEHSVRDVVFGGGELLDQTVYAQSGLFAFEVALAALLESWGVRPDVVVGHSIGELSAAFVAGVWSLSDAARLVAARGRLMQSLPSGGAMTAIAASEHEVTEALVAGVGIAAVNGPDAVVISGEADAVAAVAEVFAGRGRKVKSLAVSHAFHSHLMEPMLAEFAEIARAIEYSEPTIPVISTVTGEKAEWSSPQYWVDQVRLPVRYADAVAAVPDASAWVEVGPDGALTSMMPDSVRAVALSRRDRSEVRTLLTGLAELFTLGVRIDWAHHVPAAAWAELPTYAFQRESYWLSGTASDPVSLGLRGSAHPFLRALVEQPETGGVVLTGRVSLATHPWLADHAIAGAVLVPGAALVEMVIHAGDRVSLPVLDELVVETPMRLTAMSVLRLQVTVGGLDATGRRPVSVHSQEEDETWIRHATGFLTAEAADQADLGAWPPAGAEPVRVDELYTAFADNHYDYGPLFRSLTAAWVRGDEMFGEVVLPEQTDVSGFGVHPALLDAALHTTALRASADDSGIQLPFAWTRVALHATGATAVRVRAVRGPDGTALELADREGRPVLSVGSLVTRSISPDQLADSAARSGDRLFAVEWRPLARQRSASALVPIKDADGLREAHGQVVLDVTTGAGDEPERVRTVLRTVLEVLQAFVADPGRDSARLVVATSGAVAATTSDVVDPVAAAVWGLVRAAQAEHPDRFLLADFDGGHVVDVDALAAAREWQVAVRDGVPFVPRLVRAQGGRGGVPAEGAVLITGGTGALGALVARHLVAQHGVRELVLASRRGAAAPGAAELCAELAELGALVDVVACDLAERDQAESLLGSRSFTAVVHAAGVLDDGVITALSPERVDAVLRPKVDAAAHLDDLTRGKGLSAFVLFSSAAGVLGSGGQGSYAAANAYLDALAERRHAAGEAAVSLAWGAWENGMAGQLGHAELNRMARSGMRALDTAQGMALLDIGLGSERPVLVPAALDVAALRRGEPPSFLAEITGKSRPTASTGPSAEEFTTRLAGLTDAERLELLTDLVCAEAASVLGTASLRRPTQAFKDAGFDSLTAVELRNRLTGLTGVKLPATMVFDYPNPAVLARLLSGRLAGGAVGDVDEAELRRGLLDLPIGRLRDAGLLEPLRRLVAAEAVSAPPDLPDADLIDELDTASLLDLVQEALSFDGSEG